MMSNKDFQKLSILYTAIKDINAILTGAFGLKMGDNKLDAVLNAVKDIDKNELSDEITEQIIENIKEGVTALYIKELLNLNENIVNIDVNPIKDNTSGIINLPTPAERLAK